MMLTSTGEALPSRKRRRWWFAALATVIVLAAIVGFSRPETIAQVLDSIGWSGIAIIVVLYSITQILRTARIWYLLPARYRPSFRIVLAIVAVHQCLNHLLPVRLGEASFPLLMKRYAAVPAAPALSLLLVMRLQELVVLVIFFAGALVLHLLKTTGDLPIGLLLAISALGVVGLALAFRLLPAFLRVGSAILRRPRLLPSFGPFKARIASFLDQVGTEWTAPVSPYRRGLAWCLTIAIWFNTCFISLQGMRLSGFKISYVETVLGSTIASLSYVLPINAFGGFGSLEAGWTFGFAALGFDPRGVLAVAFVLHVLLLLLLIVSALIAWTWLQSAGARNGERDQG